MTSPPQQPEPNQQSHVPYGTDPYTEPTREGPFPPHQLPPGQPVSPMPYGAQQPVYVVQQQPASGMAVTSLVLGILGLVGSCCTFGVFSLCAVVFGHVALSETKSGQKSGHGMAIAGLVMGYVFFLPAILFSIWMVVAGGIGAVTGGIDPTPTPTP